MSGRHRAGVLGRRGAHAGYVGVAVVLMLLLSFGGWTLVHRVGCAEGETRLQVAAAPDIAPAVADVAASADDDRLRCVDIEVSTREPADVAAGLASAGSSPGDLPDVWIPDSSVWVTVAREAPSGRRRPGGSITSVASSPIVIAVPRAAAERLNLVDSRLGWGSLLPHRSNGQALRVKVADPTRDAATLLGLVAVRSLIADNADAAATSTAVFRELGSTAAPTTSALFESFASSAGGSTSWFATIAAEQSVWAYNHGGAHRAATAIYPSEGTLDLDYPYVSVTRSSADEPTQSATDGLRAALGSEEGQRILHSYGFRTPDGRAGQQLAQDASFDPSVPTYLHEPTPNTILGALKGWRTLNRGIRTLVLFDVSGSMQTVVPGTQHTRMQETVAVARQGLALFPGDTEMGLWVFSTRLDGDKDYKEVVPIGGLDDRRADIVAALSSIRARPYGDTGLYDTILAAHRAITKTYDPDRVNSVIVLTDGRNDDDHGISLRGLLGELERETDPTHPVPVISIAFGPDIDPGPLEKIGAATGGDAFVTRDPAQVRKVFLQAIGQRTCRPRC